MKEIAQRMNRIKPSPTLAITTKAKELKSQGKNVIGFGAGEPDFDTPNNIKLAAKKALDEGKTKYTPVSGTNELKDAVIYKLKTENGLEYTSDEIIITNGGKHSLFGMFMALIDEGDEVIIPAPYWVSYPDQISLFGGQPVIVKTDDQSGFKIKPEGLEKAITPKTVAVVINSPSNPTGAAYTKEELKALAAVCLKHNLYIIADEIYEHMVYDEFSFVSVASLSPEIKNITLTTNGVSKCYSMTGWRMGFTAGPAHIIKAMSKAQGQSTSNVCSITQAACVEAYYGPQQAVTDMVAAFKERRDYIVFALNAIEGVKCNTPQGAFYVFPNISSLFGKKTKEGKIISSSEEFCLALLEDYGVAAVPGSAFGAEGYFRISYATGMDDIKDGVNRIENMISGLKA